MKKYMALVCILCLYPLFGFAQKMRISDLEKYLNMGGVGQIDQFLVLKNWNFYENATITEGIERRACWAYWEDPYDRNDDWANAWLYAYVDSRNGKITGIEYICFNLDDYAYLVNSLEASQYKYLRSYDYATWGFTPEAYVRSHYQNSNNYLVLESYKEDGTTRWVVQISPKCGRFDSENGKKVNYLHTGQLSSEYELKDGYFINEHKAYYANGKIFEKITISFNELILEKYNIHGKKVSTLVIPLEKKHKLRPWDSAEAIAHGSYVKFKDEPMRDLPSYNVGEEIQSCYEGEIHLRFLFTGPGMIIEIVD